MSNLVIINRMQEMLAGDKFENALEHFAMGINNLYLLQNSKLHAYQTRSVPYMNGRTRTFDDVYNRSIGWQTYVEGTELLGDKVPFSQGSYTIDEPYVSAHARSYFDQIVDHVNWFDFSGGNAPFVIEMSRMQKWARHLDLNTIQLLIRAARGHVEFGSKLPNDDAYLGVSGYGNTLGNPPVDVNGQSAAGSAIEQCYRPELKLPNFVTADSIRDSVLSAQNLLMDKSDNDLSLMTGGRIDDWTLYIRRELYNLLIKDAKALDITIGGTGSYTFNSLGTLSGLRLEVLDILPKVDDPNIGKIPHNSALPDANNLNDSWILNRTPPSHGINGVQGKYWTENPHTTAMLLVHNRQAIDSWEPLKGIRTFTIDVQRNLSWLSASYAYTGGGIRNYAKVAEICYAKPPRTPYDIGTVADGYNDAP